MGDKIFLMVTHIFKYKIPCPKYYVKYAVVALYITLITL